MVDGERFADCGRGVYVDTGLTVGALADHARYDRHAELHKLVGDTVVGYGLDAGIAVYHFLYGIGGRVAMVCSLDIGVEYPAQLGKGLYERKSFSAARRCMASYCGMESVHVLIDMPACICSTRR